MRRLALPWLLTGAFGLVAVGAVVWGLVSSSSSGHGSAATTTTAVSTRYKTLLDAGLLLLRQGNSNAAEQVFQQAIQADPSGSQVAYYDLGVVYDQESDTSKALAAYEHAVAVDTRYVPALYNEAVLLAPTDPSGAQKLYQEVIALQPDSPTALLNLGLLDAARNDTSGAKAMFSRAVQLDPPLRARIPAAYQVGLAGP